VKAYSVVGARQCALPLQRVQQEEYSFLSLSISLYEWFNILSISLKTHVLLGQKLGHPTNEPYSLSRVTISTHKLQYLSLALQTLACYDAAVYAHLVAAQPEYLQKFLKFLHGESIIYRVFTVSLCIDD
jgi:hypothetical protein